MHNMTIPKHIQEQVKSSSKSGTHAAVEVPEELRAKVENYASRLIRDSERPQAPRDARSKAERVHERLQRVEVRSQSADEKRMQLIVQELALRLQIRDFDSVYALAVELGHSARVQVLGLRGAHPILPSAHSMPPPALEPGGD